MKNSLKFMFSTLALSFSAVSMNAYSATLIKVHSDMTEDSAQQEGIERFKQLVEARSDGQYEVKIYANNALGNDVEVAQQMQFGAVQAAPIPTAKLSGFDKDLQLIDMPFLFPSRKVAYQFLDGEIGDEVLSGLRSSGFEPAMFWESGFKQMTCNDPITKPADMQDRKVRVMESPLLISQYKALGSNPVPIAFSETYTALQQGVVECQENPLVSISQMKFYEVQKDLMLTNHGYLGTAFVFSKIWFDSQSAKNQQLLIAAAREAGHYQRERSIAREEVYLNGIKQAGNTEVISLTPEQLGEFRNAMSPVYQEFGAKLSQGLLDRAQAKLSQLSEM
ncbi:TRAP transporter substrate-binding protein [Vibrio sp. H11]|uniref:TRAP transporter substrate-binding protein n=1 Tax=Vibrio sp. H11 TaxID=2565928 RepID=UPI0010A6A5E4|nr:TRAP transporter substrate-binding protein [Vibrio sp. H11]